MTKNTLKLFGSTIRYYRNQLKISQEKLAERSGFHRTYIGQIERGERNPSLKSIEVFTRTFGITFAELFNKFEQLKKERS